MQKHWCFAKKDVFKNLTNFKEKHAFESLFNKKEELY